MIKSYKLFLESRESEIESICKQYDIQNWSLNEDGSIDVNGDVSLRNKGLDRFPLKFRHVSGHFLCNVNRLTSLEGAPESVGRNFYCHTNKLTSLKGCPQLVGGGFYCGDNQLTSLEGAPESIDGDFSCCDNKLTSLEGCPKSGEYFLFDNNQLTSLEGFPENFISIYVTGNPISEFIRLFTKLTPDIVRYLNEYDVIQDDIIVLDRLKEVVDTLGIQFNFKWLKGLENYVVEE